MSDYESDDSDVQDFKDLDMIFELGRLEQQEQEEAERVHHRNYIYRERVEAEARLMADYFGPRQKYPDDYFRLACCYALGMEKKLRTKSMAWAIGMRYASQRRMYYINGNEEGARKDIERAFGVLQGRWGL
ncbi:ribosomal protein [Tanacetum coccineum]